MSGTKADWTRIGRIADLSRYVLKGTQGETLTSAKLGWHGLSFDRRVGFLREEESSGLPWASPREFAQLVTWQASLTSGSDLSIVAENLELGVIVNLDDMHARRHLADMISGLLGEPVTLMNVWAGLHDAMCLSIISTDTVSALAECVGNADLDARRFRTNIIVDTNGARPWPERQWLGRELRLGEPGAAIVRVDRHTTRCEVIDLNPDTGQPDLELFATVREVNRNRAGVYASPVHVGIITHGADVYIR